MLKLPIIVSVNALWTTIFASLGWIGAGLYLFAYFLVSRGRLAGDSLRYQGLCIVSGVFLSLACLATSSWPSLFTNVVFVGIGFFIIFTSKRAYLKSRISEVASRAKQSPAAPAQPAPAHAG